MASGITKPFFWTHETIVVDSMALILLLFSIQLLLLLVHLNVKSHEPHGAARDFIEEEVASIAREGGWMGMVDFDYGSFKS